MTTPDRQTQSSRSRPPACTQPSYDRASQPCGRSATRTSGENVAMMLAPIVALAAALRAPQSQGTELARDALQAERISKGTFMVLGRFRLTASKPGGRLRRQHSVQDRTEGSDRV
jgi:hypothetical protein